MLGAILREHPGVRGHLVDLPPTAARAAEELAAALADPHGPALDSVTSVADDRALLAFTVAGG